MTDAAKTPFSQIPMEFEEADEFPDGCGGVTLASAKQLREKLRQMAASAKTPLAAAAALDEVQPLLENMPEEAETACALLQLRERAGQVQDLHGAWRAIYERFPEEHAAVLGQLRALMADKDEAGALALVDRHFPDAPDSVESGLVRAGIFSDLGLHERADQTYQSLVKASPGRRRVRVEYAKRLRKRGRIVHALEVLEPVRDRLVQRAASLYSETAALIDLLRREENEEDIREHDARLFAMKHALLHFKDRETKRALPGSAPKPMRQVAMVTGSLSPGGAERQLSNMAVQLAQSDDVALKPEVIVKSHRANKADFFMPELVEAGVKVSEIHEMKPVMVSRQPIDDARLAKLVEYLPPQVHYGVVRLTPYLRERGFDVVSLWQDGSCLIGALAALLAGVPNIHLVFRGLPPNIRTHRQRPEYPVLYRALAQVPGVCFATNSRTAAAEYAQWLDLDIDKFTILYNGIREKSVAAGPNDLQQWAEFSLRTSDATETIGGVFRFESDKAPLRWIKMARQYLRRRPKARFIIVGGGRLYDEVVALAHKLGVADRLLFVGSTPNVGFWYDKMDVKVLLSRFEGLPNVLIEAQGHGVPVVSTPAGGAVECMVTGSTGHLLSCAENPCMDEACDLIESLVNRPREDVLEVAERLIEERFSLERYLETFLSISQ